MEELIAFIVSIGVQYPKLVPMLAMAYLLGVALKIVSKSIEEFVLLSPSKSDDIKLEAVKKHKAVKAVLFLADLLIRLKIK